MTKKKLLEDIKAKPAHFYRMPADVLRDRRFADCERLEILRAWAVSAMDDSIAGQLDGLIAEMEIRQPTSDHIAP